MAPNPIEELVHLLRLHKYHKRRRGDRQERVNKLKVSCEIQKRLIKSQPRFQRILADSIRNDSKGDFRSAFDALRDVRDLAANLASGRTSIASEDLMRQEVARQAESQSFLDRISRDSRERVLRFISDIVSSPDFLVRRLLTLNQRQLEHLHLGQYLTLADRSVLGHFTSSPPRRASPGSTGSTQSESRAASLVWDLCRHDAFSLLLDLVGLFPASIGNSVRRRQELTWATVCARMLSDSQPGREKFVVAIIDAMAYEIEPSGRRALESWIEETLREGQFLLSISDNPLFNASDASNESDESKAFFTSAIGKLFALLKDNEQTHIIPTRALNLCRLTVDKLRDSDTRFRTAPSYFVAHWLFSTFMLDMTITPEVRGLMLTSPFSETARYRILQRTILKAQKIVFDVSYAWTHTVPVEPALRAEIDAIANLFKPTKADRSVDTQDAQSSDYFLRSLSPADVHTLVQALYPDKRGGIAFSSTTISPAGASSASSVSGLSIFRESAFDDLDTDRIPRIPGNDSNLSTESDVSSRTPASPGSNVPGDEDPAVAAAGLRSSCSEIQTVSKSDLTYGLRHPSHASWALLELRDGHVRNIDRIHTFAVEQCEIETSGDSDQDNDFRSDTEQNNTYLDIRRDLLRLLTDPSLAGLQSADVEVRSSDMMLPFPSSRKTNNPFSGLPEKANRSDTNPYRNRNRSLSEVMHEASLDPQVSETETGKPSSRWPSTLSGVFQRAIRQLEHTEDYAKAFVYSQTLTRIKVLSSSNPNTESSILGYFIRDVEQNVSRSQSAAAKLDVLASLLEQQYIETESWVNAIASVANRTRTKMWYCVDIRAAASYADLHRLAIAIRDMDLSKQSNIKKTDPPPLRHKGTLKPKALDAIKKGEASVLELMVSDPAYRVLNKLKDEQVIIVQQWMDKSGIENICNGEERLHRLLCEVSKCLSQLITSDPITSPVLWGSELFQRDRMEGEVEAVHRDIADTREAASFHSRPGSHGSESVHGDYPGRARRKSEFNFATASLNSPDLSSDYLDSKSPTLLTRSSTTLWSPSGYRSQSPFSNISPPSRPWSPMHLRQSVSRESFQAATRVKGLLHDLRQSVTGLLVSEFMQTVCPSGSETDVAFFRGIGREYMEHQSATSDSPVSEDQDTDEKNSRRDSKLATFHKKPSSKTKKAAGTKADKQKRSSKSEQPSDTAVFDAQLAKRRLVRRFDLSNGPYEKLKILHDLQMLMSTMSPPTTLKATTQYPISLIRTRLEPLLASEQSSLQLQNSINHFKALFEDQSTRPPHLFRDLQCIASLLPQDLLNDTSAGRAFWSATTAALMLKSAATQAVVAAADNFFSQYMSRNPSIGAGTGSAPVPSPTPPVPKPLSLEAGDPDPLASASVLLRLAAVQGHPVAQRELAIMYLTHPDRVPRVLAPLSRIADVFKTTTTTQTSKWGGVGGAGGGGTSSSSSSSSAAREGAGNAPRKYDDGQDTMRVAGHWMSLAAKAGDVVAQRALK